MAAICHWLLMIAYAGAALAYLGLNLSGGHDTPPAPREASGRRE